MPSPWPRRLSERGTGASHLRTPGPDGGRHALHDARLFRPDDLVSASELAQLGACERVVRFEALYGRRRTATQRQAVARGLVEHARFYEGLGSRN